MKRLCRTINNKWANLKLAYYTLCYNEFISKDYVTDTLLQPIFWFVDNFTKVLGPIFLVGVACLVLSVVIIAYLIGLPFYWNKSPMLTCFLVVFGNWVLVNVCFHFYMAASTDPGYLRSGIKITESVSICKNCISPKPPRTHHCSICNQCVLKMDHHCPWLNNCVGHYNHRYFLSFCFYTALGTLFIVVFGAEILYINLFGDLDNIVLDEESQSNFSTNLFVKFIYYIVIRFMGLKNRDLNDDDDDDVQNANVTNSTSAVHRKYNVCILYESLLTSGVFIAVAALTTWHLKLILRGETSIEKHINAKETKRLRKLNKVFRNPYDFGPRKNLRAFLGLQNGRTWLLNFMLPSRHKPEGDGMRWPRNYDYKKNLGTKSPNS